MHFKLGTLLARETSNDRSSLMKGQLSPQTIERNRVFMKNIFMVALVLISTSAFAGLKEDMQGIADNAEVGNGSANLKAYIVKDFNAETALSKDLSDVKKEFDQGDFKCGPFKITKDRRQTIKVVASGMPGDKATAAKLTELNNQKKILKAYSITTNNEIECSRSWVEVYTTDGLHLALYYGMND